MNISNKTSITMPRFLLPRYQSPQSHSLTGEIHSAI